MKIYDNGTEREATADEIVYYEAWQKDIVKEAKAKAIDEANKAKAKQAVLDRLGITADEAQLLLG